MKYVTLFFVVVLISCSETKISPGTSNANDPVNLLEDTINVVNTNLKSLNDSLYVYLNILEQEKLDSIKNLAFANSDNPFMESKFKKWVNGTISIKGIKHDAQIKYHGTSVLHYENNKYSYSIKWVDSLGPHNYKLIKGEEAFPSIAAINKIALKNNLISSTGSMRVGIINGINKGIYYLIEPLKEAYIKDKFKHKEFVVLSHIADWSRKERSGISPSHSSEIDLFSGHIKNDETPLFPKALYQYKMLSEDIQNESIQKIKSKVDLDYMAKYLAIALIFNDVHFMTGDNLKLLYDFNQKKFYPLFRIETEGVPFESYLDTNFIELNKFLFSSRGEHYSKAPFLKFFSLLVKDNEFRSKRDKYLYQFLINKEDIFKELEFIHLQNSSVMNLIDEEKNYIHINRIKRQKHIVNTAFNLIHKYLNYAHIYCTYNKSKKVLELNIDSFSPVNMYFENKLILENYSGINFSEDLKIIQSSKQIKLDVNLFAAENLTFVNSITKDTIREHVYVNFIDSK